MTARAHIPTEPTLDMCIAYMRALGYGKRELRDWTEYLRDSLGSPHECGFASALRAALHVGAGLMTVDQVIRGKEPKKPLARPRSWPEPPKPKPKGIAP